MIRASLQLVLLLSLAVVSSVQANSVRLFTLSADEWARPRGGDVIIELAPVRAAVNYWLQTDDAIVVVRSPGEDSGELWAAELRDWLVTRGISSSYIRLVAGAGQADSVTLMVGNQNELQY